MTDRLDIILPAYHEQGNIEHVILGIEKNVRTSHKITVVLQDKNDPTKKVLDQLKRKVKPLNYTFTQDGKGMLKAFREGFKSTKAPIITMMMSDRSDDPKDIDSMVEKINEGYDLVCASRYINPGERVGGPKFKGFLSWFACKSLRLLTGIPTNDSTNAFKTFKRPIIQKIKIESKEGFEMPLEITVKAHKLGYKISEVPTIWRDRKKGDSQFRLFRNLPYYLRWYLYAIVKKAT